MTSNHARKNRARRVQKRTGAAYTSAAFETVHQHDGGPRFTDVDAAGYGADRIVPMHQATALVAATVAECLSCQATLTTAIAAGDPVVVAALASILWMPGELGPHMSPATRHLHPAVRLATVTMDSTPILHALTGMTDEERACVTRDCASVWAAVAQAPHTGPLLVADLTPTTGGSAYRLTGYVEAPHRTGPLAAMVLGNEK